MQMMSLLIVRCQTCSIEDHPSVHQLNMAVITLVIGNSAKPAILDISCFSRWSSCGSLVGTDAECSVFGLVLSIL